MMSPSNKALQELTKRGHPASRPLRGPASLSPASQLNAGVIRTPGWCQALRVASLQAGVLVLSLAAISCGIPDEYARTWEGNHGGKFLPGYSDYRGEDDGTDNGYVIMSYTLPAAVPAAQAVSLTRAQVQTQTPC